MLYSRPLLCILLLLASALQGTVVYAQNDEPPGSERQRKRLGDSPVHVERELDLAVPSGEEKSSDSPGEEQLTEQQLIDHQLAAATAALQAGRVDQPPNDCAWSHYRKVLDIDPENEEALQGLIVVQEAMVARAVEAAKDLDFESATSTLNRLSEFWKMRPWSGNLKALWMEPSNKSWRSGICMSKNSRPRPYKPWMPVILPRPSVH